MKHDYASYIVPAPVIKEPETVVEDVAGSLTTTHTLLGNLTGEIEGLQDIARQQEKTPGSICPDAMKSRLESLWALAEAISRRVKDDTILLYALVDKRQQGAQS